MSEPLRLNLTNEEANSKARSYVPPPTGTYLCNITEIEERPVKVGAKNAGKLYWRISFVIDDGKFAGTPFRSNIMLFEGSLHYAKQLVESVFPHMVEDNAISIPNAEAFLGKQVQVTGKRFEAGSTQKGGYVRENPIFEVKGFMPAGAKQKTGDTSLLPS